MLQELINQVSNYNGEDALSELIEHINDAKDHMWPYLAVTSGREEMYLIWAEDDDEALEIAYDFYRECDAIYVPRCMIELECIDWIEACAEVEQLSPYEERMLYMARNNGFEA